MDRAKTAAIDITAFKDNNHEKLALTLAGLALAGAAFAQTLGGGSTGERMTFEVPTGRLTGQVVATTVAQAKTLPDDTKVTLRGNIESHLGGKSTCSRTPAAPQWLKQKKHWAGPSVAPQDTVQMDGEVD